MNTDKLMELERKWREQADSAMRNSGTWSGDQMANRVAYMADELAAALRAEQAVGEDGRLPCPFGDACVGRDCNRCGNFTPGTARQSECGEDKLPSWRSGKAAARQSEGMVLVPREPTPEMIAAGRDELGAYVEDTDDDYRRIYRRFIAAAPGGEGEG